MLSFVAMIILAFLLVSFAVSLMSVIFDLKHFSYPGFMLMHPSFHEGFKEAVKDYDIPRFQRAVFAVVYLTFIGGPIGVHNVTAAAIRWPLRVTIDICLGVLLFKKLLAKKNIDAEVSKFIVQHTDEMDDAFHEELKDLAMDWWQDQEMVLRSGSEVEIIESKKLFNDMYKEHLPGSVQSKAEDMFRDAIAMSTLRESVSVDKDEFFIDFSETMDSEIIRQIKETQNA